MAISEQSIKNAIRVTAVGARIAVIHAIKNEARQHRYNPRYIDPARDYHNLISHIEAVDNRIARLREDGRKGHWTYNTNHLFTALGERLALRLRRMQVYSDKMKETE